MTQTPYPIEDISEHRRVLVIDDSPEVIDAIKAGLGKSFEVMATTQSSKAQELAQKLQPDLILLDIVMPELDGYEVCEQLKSDVKTRHIPVIFVTGLDSDIDELKGFALGAVDYVTKPPKAVILQARAKAHIELSLTRSALHQANEELTRERELMAGIVRSMRKQKNFCNANIKLASHSHDIASGDLVSSALAPNGDQHILLGDFTGHGLPAAIGSPLVSQIFYSMTSQGKGFPEILATINNVLVSQLPNNIFMATIALEIEANTNIVKIWNFGVPDVLYRLEEHKWEHLASKGLPLGIIKSEDLEHHHRLDIKEGGYVYAMSDGLIETVTTEGSMFGEKRLKASIDVEPDDLEALIDTVINSAKQGQELDDLTVMRISSPGEKFVGVEA